MSNNDVPTPILAIAVKANTENHQVLVELGSQTLSLPPEAAHALSTALIHAATQLCPIAAERPSIATPAVPAGHVGPAQEGLVAAELLINTIAVLVDRYRQGTLAAPPIPDSNRDRPVSVSVKGGASISAPR